MVDLRETSIDRLQGESFCTVYSNERKYVNKLLELKKEHGDLVNIQCFYDNENDYSIQAQVPAHWFKFVGPKRKGREMTEEEKAKSAERLAKAREAKKRGKG